MSKGASRLINLIKLPQRGALSGGRLVGDCWLGWSDLAFFAIFYCQPSIGSIPKNRQVRQNNGPQNKRNWF